MLIKIGERNGITKNMCIFMQKSWLGRPEDQM